MLRFTAASIALLLAASTALADGLIQKLPPDGAWLRYRFEARDEDAVTGTLTVRFVGTTELDGEPCRWMEWDLVFKDEDGVNPVVLKLLVPEKEFAAGRNPLDQVKTGWWRPDGEEVEHFGEERFREDVAGDDEARWLYLLFGPLDDPGTLDRKLTVKTLKGEFECTGRRGLVKAADGKQAANGWLTLWSHAKLPTGIAAAETAYEGDDDLIRVSLKLEDFGTDARTKLPNYE